MADVKVSSDTAAYINPVARGAAPQQTTTPPAPQEDYRLTEWRERLANKKESLDNLYEREKTSRSSKERNKLRDRIRDKERGIRELETMIRKAESGVPIKHIEDLYDRDNYDGRGKVRVSAQATGQNQAYQDREIEKIRANAKNLTVEEKQRFQRKYGPLKKPWEPAQPGRTPPDQSNPPLTRTVLPAGTKLPYQTPYGVTLKRTTGDIALSPALSKKLSGMAYEVAPDEKGVPRVRGARGKTTAPLTVQKRDFDTIAETTVKNVITTQKEEKPNTRLQRYRERVERLESSEQKYFTSKYFTVTDKIGSYLTLGGGAPQESRGAIGGTAQIIVSGVLQAPAAIPGIAYFTGGKAAAFGEAIMFKETRSEIASELWSPIPKIEQTSFSFLPGGTPINRQGAAAVIAANLYAIPKGVGAVRNIQSTGQIKGNIDVKGRVFQEYEGYGYNPNYPLAPKGTTTISYLEKTPLIQRLTGKTAVSTTITKTEAGAVIKTQQYVNAAGKPTGNLFVTSQEAGASSATLRVFGNKGLARTSQVKPIPEGTNTVEVLGESKTARAQPEQISRDVVRQSISNKLDLGVTTKAGGKDYIGYLEARGSAKAVSIAPRSKVTPQKIAVAKSGEVITELTGKSKYPRGRIAVADTRNPVTNERIVTKQSFVNEQLGEPTRPPQTIETLQNRIEVRSMPTSQGQISATIEGTLAPSTKPLLDNSKIPRGYERPYSYTSYKNAVATARPTVQHAGTFTPPPSAKQTSPLHFADLENVPVTVRVQEISSLKDFKVNLPSPDLKATTPTTIIIPPSTEHKTTTTPPVTMVDAPPTQQVYPSAQTAPVVKVQPVADLFSVQNVQPVQRITPITRARPVQEVRPVQRVNNVQEVRPVQRITPVQEVRPVQRITPVERLQPLQRITTVARIPPLQPVIPVVPIFGGGGRKREEQKYNVFVRRGGKFTRINNRPMTAEEAVRKGRKRVEGTLAASFKVTSTEGEPLTSPLLPSSFTRSKRDRGVFVQRPGARLSGFGEREEISLSKKRRWI